MLRATITWKQHQKQDKNQRRKRNHTAMHIKDPSSNSQIKNFEAIPQMKNSERAWG
jgi:hypothetical protein